jgi:hypothetical protein
MNKFRRAFFYFFLQPLLPKSFFLKFVEGLRGAPLDFQR